MGVFAEEIMRQIDSREGDFQQDTVIVQHKDKRNELCSLLLKKGMQEDKFQKL